MKRWYENLSLSQKLSLVVLSTIAVTLIVVFPVVFFVHNVETRNLVKSEASRLGESLVPGARMAIAGGDEALDQWAVEYNRLPGVHKIVLYDSAWKVLRYVGAEPEGHGEESLDKHTFVEGGEALCLTQMIRSGTEVTGYIHLELDVRWLSKQSRKSFFNWLAILGAALLLGFVLARRFLEQIARPLQGLVDTLEKIGATRDYSVRAEKQSNDELGLLADRFNEMLDQVQQRTSELQSAHGQLQKRLLDLHQSKDQMQRLASRENELLEKLSKKERMESVGLLAGGIAHDLNNILGPVVGLPELVIEDLGEGHPSIPDIVQMQDSAMRAKAIIQDLLALGRRGRIEFKPVNLNHLVEAFLKSPVMADRQRLQPGIAVQTTLSEEEPTLMGAEAQLHQLVMNLVLNAFEAMPKGGQVTVRTHVETVSSPRTDGFETVPKGMYSVLQVIDSGGGIPEDAIKWIFDPFYSRKRLGQSGTGLGLAVVFGVLKDHGGYVDVETAAHEGTTFSVYIPHQEGAADVMPAALLQPASGEKVVVIDDVAEQRDLGQRILGHAGYRVQTAVNGRDGLTVLEQESFDVVLIDMIMEEDFDGLQTCRAILEKWPGQRCIIVSGYSESDRAAEALRVGARSFLQKPYTREGLVDSVRKVLAAGVNLRRRGDEG